MCVFCLSVCLKEIHFIYTSLVRLNRKIASSTDCILPTGRINLLAHNAQWMYFQSRKKYKKIYYSNLDKHFLTSYLVEK